MLYQIINIIHVYRKSAWFWGHSSFTPSVLTFMNQMIQWIDAQVPSATSIWVCFLASVFKVKMDCFGKVQISKTGKNISKFSP